MLSRVGKYLPKVKFPSQLNKWYTTSLHKQLKGEWEFNLDWKPTSAPTVQLSFCTCDSYRAKEIHHGVKLNVPALIMHSHQTKTRANGDQMQLEAMSF